MANRYWVGGTATWDNTAGTKWALTSGGAGGQAVPTSSDDVFFDSNSGAVTVTLFSSNANVKTLNCTGFTGSLVETNSNSTINLNGNLYLTPGMTLTGIKFNVTGTGTVCNINSSGKTFTRGWDFASTGGTYTFEDSFTSTSTIILGAGTLSTNDKNWTFDSILFGSSPTFNMGSSTISLTGQGLVWDTDLGGVTINAGTSTIKFTNTTNNSVTFGGNGETYNNVWFDRGASTGGITILGTNTFAQFKDTGTAAHTITFPNVTTTVTSFVVNGSAGNVITLQRTGGSGTWTISDTTGTNTCEYISLSNSTATGGATFNAFLEDGSVDGGGNTGWNFYDIADVTTDPVTNTLLTTATGNGSVDDDRGSAITERGIVVGTSINPTTSDMKFSTSGTTGDFSVSLTGLSKGTSYYARAYAINTGGTAYGENETFETLGWTMVAKPSAQTWTNSNPQGKEQYDQVSILYDDSSVFYDGINQSQWTDISKPSGPVWTKVPKPTT